MAKIFALYLLKLYLLFKLLSLALLVLYSSLLFFVALEDADLVALCQLLHIVVVG